MRLRRIPSTLWRTRMRWLPLSSFERDFREVEPFTMVGTRRLENLHRSVVAIHENDVPGDIVECGVARGGSSALLAKAMGRHASTRTLWMLDSFEGMPEPSQERDPDYEEAMRYVGTCRGNQLEVEQLVSSVAPQVKTVTIPGRYEETLPDAHLPEKVALLHVDCDWYDPVKLVLSTFWPKVAPAGVVQIDDFFTWEGCRRAVDELLAAEPAIRWQRIDTSGIWFQRPT